ncbi:MAG: HK97-fold major capsid protein [Candidatus Hodarchaeales archaeon]
MNTKEMWQAFADEMKAAVSNPEDRHAIADKIVKYISDSIEQRDVSSLLLPKEVIPVGTSAEYAVPTKLKAYWHEPGSYAPRTSMVQKIFTVPTWMVSAHPEYEISQLEAGRYGTVQDQVKAARDAILGAINARVFNTVSGSISSGDANYFSSVGSFTRASLEQAINYVEDQYGTVKAIVGRRNLLYPMIEWNTNATYGDMGLFGDSTKEKLINTTKMPTYRGIPIVGLPQWRDGFGKLTIPQDTVLVIGEDMGRYVVSQDLRSKDTIDVDTLMWHIHLYMRVGAAVFFPERAAKIVVG